MSTRSAHNLLHEVRRLRSTCTSWGISTQVLPCKKLFLQQVTYDCAFALPRSKISSHRTWFLFNGYQCLPQYQHIVKFATNRKKSNIKSLRGQKREFNIEVSKLDFGARNFWFGDRNLGFRARNLGFGDRNTVSELGISVLKLRS